MADVDSLGQDYVLHEQLGQGATGVVRRASRRDGASVLAAKLLRADLSDDRRVRNLFLQEEAALRDLHHESIVAVVDVVFERGRLALLLELVDGPDLRRYLGQAGGTLPPPDACAIAAQVAGALAAAHVQGVVHLDVKPENILVERGTRPPRVKVTDFGIAAILLDAGKSTAALGGTLGYIAPEVLQDLPPTAAADVYALGVMLAEMVTGTRPNSGGGRGRPGGTIGEGLPPPLDRIVRDCLDPDPRQRPTARSIAARLAAAADELVDVPANAPAGPRDHHQAEPTRLRGRTSPPRPDPPSLPTGTHITRTRAAAVLAGLAAAVVLLTASIYVAFRLSTSSEVEQPASTSTGAPAGSRAAALSVVSRTPGSLDVFAATGDGRLKHRNFSNNQWSCWAELYWNTRIKGEPAAIAGAGRIDVFALGVDNRLKRITWVTTHGWSEWADLGDYRLTSTPAVTSRSATGIDVFATDAAAKVVYRHFDIARNAWTTNWLSIGGNAATFHTSGAPAAIANREGTRINVFARAVDGSLLTVMWTMAAGWADWADLGGNVTGRPAAITRSDSSVDVILRDHDNSMIHRHSPDGVDWTAHPSGDLGGHITASPTAASWNDQRIDVFSQDRNRNLVQSTWTSAKGWSSWAGHGPVGAPACT